MMCKQLTWMVHWRCINERAYWIFGAKRIGGRLFVRVTVKMTNREIAARYLSTIGVDIEDVEKRALDAFNPGAMPNGYSFDYVYKISDLPAYIKKKRKMRKDYYENRHKRSVEENTLRFLEWG